MTLLSGTVLPEGIGGKVEGFVAGRTGCTAKTKAEGFAPNPPGPSGFRAAGARCVEPLARTTGTNFALLLAANGADRLTARETELFPDNNIMV